MPPEPLCERMAPTARVSKNPGKGLHMTVSAQDVRAAAPANAPENVINFVARLAKLGKPEKVHCIDIDESC